MVAAPNNEGHVACVYGMDQTVQTVMIGKGPMEIREVCGEVCGVNLNAIKNQMATIWVQDAEMFGRVVGQESECNPWVKGMYGPVVVCSGRQTADNRNILRDTTAAAAADVMQWIATQALLDDRV
jgi:hypothetical protein